MNTDEHGLGEGKQTRNSNREIREIRGKVSLLIAAGPLWAGAHRDTPPLGLRAPLSPTLSSRGGEGGLPADFAGVSGICSMRAELLPRGTGRPTVLGCPRDRAPSREESTRGASQPR